MDTWARGTRKVRGHWGAGLCLLSKNTVLLRYTKYINILIFNKVKQLTVIVQNEELTKNISIEIFV